MMYTYLRNNAEWLLQQLGVSDIEPSEFQQLPGQKVTEEKPNLLTMMFHIGHQPFDMVSVNFIWQIISNKFDIYIIININVLVTDRFSPHRLRQVAAYSNVYYS